VKPFYLYKNIKLYTIVFSEINPEGIDP